MKPKGTIGGSRPSPGASHASLTQRLESRPVKSKVLDSNPGGYAKKKEKDMLTKITKEAKTWVFNHWLAEEFAANYLVKLFSEMESKGLKRYLVLTYDSVDGARLRSLSNSEVVNDSFVTYGFVGSGATYIYDMYESREKKLGLCIL